MNTLDNLLDPFLDSLGGRQSAANRRNHRTRLLPFLALHGRKTPAQISRADVRAWLQAIDQRGYRPATVSGYRQALKAFFAWMVMQKLLIESPAGSVRVGAFTAGGRSRLPAEPDVERVTALAHAWLQSDQLHQVRDAAIWLLSLGSGARLGEIRNIRRSDAAAALAQGPDAHGVYRVPSAGKTGPVVLRFGGDVAHALRCWLAVRPPVRVDALFITALARRSPSDPETRHRPLTRSAVTAGYQRICTAAGIARPILSHALRHRLGDRATRQHGAKVAALLLNHRDADTAATAIAFYSHPNEDDMSQAISDAYAGSGMDEAIRRLFRLD